MKTYKVYEAKNNLSKLLQQVEEGESVYISRGKKVIAELKPISSKQSKPFPWGILKDQAWVAEDWDSEETNAKIAQEAEDNPIFPK